LYSYHQLKVKKKQNIRYHGQWSLHQRSLILNSTSDG